MTDQLSFVRYKPLSKLMIASFTDTYVRHSASMNEQSFNRILPLETDVILMSSHSVKPNSRENDKRQVCALAQYTQNLFMLPFF